MFIIKDWIFIKAKNVAITEGKELLGVAAQNLLRLQQKKLSSNFLGSFMSIVRTLRYTILSMLLFTKGKKKVEYTNPLFLLLILCLFFITIIMFSFFHFIILYFSLQFYQLPQIFFFVMD